MKEKSVFYLDLLKFFSLYTMIICHLFTDYYLCAAESSQDLLPGLETLEQVLYLITPSVFAFCLGGGLYLSRVKTWQKDIRRGCTLLLTGLILNIFRWIIPGWITGSEGPAEGSPVVFFNLLFGSDILLFAGLFFPSLRSSDPDHWEPKDSVCNSGPAQSGKPFPAAGRNGQSTSGRPDEQPCLG